MPPPEQLTVYSNQKWANSQKPSFRINISSAQEIAGQAKEWTFQNGLFFAVNIALLLVLAVMFLFYIGQINASTSNGYKIKLLNDRISSLNETHGTLVAQKSSIEDASAIAQFAQANNMEEIKNPSAIFESGNNVALQR